MIPRARFHANKHASYVRIRDERKRERAAKHENKSLIPSAFNYRWQREGTRGERGRERKNKKKGAYVKMKTRAFRISNEVCELQPVS